MFLRVVPPTEPEAMALFKPCKWVRYGAAPAKENINVMSENELRRAEKSIMTVGLDKFYNKVMKYCGNLESRRKTISGMGWLQETNDNWTMNHLLEIFLLCARTQYFHVNTSSNSYLIAFSLVGKLGMQQECMSCPGLVCLPSTLLLRPIHKMTSEAGGHWGFSGLQDGVRNTLEVAFYYQTTVKRPKIYGKEATDFDKKNYT